MKKLKRIAIVIALIAGLISVGGIGAQSQPNFSGTWKQSNERCVPVRTVNVNLKINQRSSEFTVKTTVLRESAPARHAVQRYTTNGKVSISTGADGDEFHTSIIWRGDSLVFSIEEHEDGRIILSKEIWTLIDHGAALKRVRERIDGSEKQVLIYARQAPQP